MTSDDSGAPEPSGAPAPGPIPGARSSDAFKVGSLHRRQQEHPAWAAFLPNRVISRATLRLIAIVEAAIALVVWLNSPFKVLPRPDEVLRALRDLWMTQGLGPELINSFTLNLQALFWSSIISIGLAYLTVIPVFRPITSAISKGRFLSIAGFTLLFTLLTSGGHALKVSLLVFAITVFYVTSMASVIANIPKEEFDHARTLRMSEWRVVWEVVVLGTIDKVFEVLRQNAAIGWMMLTMVEGIVRSEGGVGGMLLAEGHHFKLAEVFAIQFVILTVGLGQDWVIGAIRKLVCPYADMKLERG